MIANLFVPSACALIQSLPRTEVCPRTRVGKHWLIRITVNRDFFAIQHPDIFRSVNRMRFTLFLNGHSIFKLSLKFCLPSNSLLWSRNGIQCVWTKYGLVCTTPQSMHCCDQWRSEAQCRPESTVKVPPFPPLQFVSLRMHRWMEFVKVNSLLVFTQRYLILQMSIYVCLYFV